MLQLKLKEKNNARYMVKIVRKEEVLIKTVNARQYPETSCKTYYCPPYQRHVSNH